MSIPSLTKLSPDAKPQPDPSLYEIIVPLIDDFLTLVGSLEDSIRVDSMKEVRRQVHLILTDKTAAYESHTAKSISDMLFSPIDTAVFGRGDQTPLSSEQTMCTGPNAVPGKAIEYMTAVTTDPNGIWRIIAAAVWTLQSALCRIMLDGGGNNGMIALQFATLIVVAIREILQKRSTWDTRRAKIGMLVAFTMDIFGYAAIGVACLGYQEMDSFFKWISNGDAITRTLYVMGQQGQNVDKSIINEVKAWSIRYIHPRAIEFRNNGDKTFTHRSHFEFGGDTETSFGVKALDDVIGIYLQTKGIDNRPFRDLIRAAMSLLTKYVYESTDKNKYLDFSGLTDTAQSTIIYVLMFITLRACVYKTLQDWSYHKDDIQTIDMKMRHTHKGWKPNLVIGPYNAALKQNSADYEICKRWGRVPFDEERMYRIFTQNGQIFEDYLGKSYTLKNATEMLNGYFYYTCAEVMDILIIRLQKLTLNQTKSDYYYEWKILYSWISAMVQDVYFRASKNVEKFVQYGDRITRYRVSKRTPPTPRNDEHFWSYDPRYVGQIYPFT